MFKCIYSDGESGLQGRHRHPAFDRWRGQEVKSTRHLVFPKVRGAEFCCSGRQCERVCDRSSESKFGDTWTKSLR